ncbi:bifunctional diaminohydroxyphosphoribosylaminopyrimidine deaminase/5-amino-6-(5-phosphoribosylamino)uracil reductase RibD [Clostridium sp. MCC353]|uniref:bifunctional diaminohydroxyphosphoribosylaminopyrimidine deaminase/5-amino-6-(5-phosphoribosylamino)uracil reductase RibD n=1 Tax=Clostridium sp. MCC353 TaxID=2592646 RepID=UPI0023DF7EFD|nr:bifunctional diaminohydroxyphosphoribosylaminopyrimidine deaminase/5-amino-6-(5-phosphoribosylamino)uracil reductase RibD [Clostridium sp. MCC353]MBT9778683.1 bifunctional diaminohydroxyphosphoribosylaminopyrimidine deaminase/5-amino-6-(5-phosphoribosylamino)uracil reductase RibD [Clostridium sp. MCC353]
MKNEEKYMALALELAEKGAGFVSPNPMVGAVVVKEGRIIGTGYHKACGQAHAERNALADCRESPEGADLYVTLEPCCHHGSTPPCTEAILQSRIARVIVGSRDPNPLVAGNGIRMLRDRGIEVVTGVLKERCDRLNEVFMHYISTGTPYVVLKYAMTLDGKIAAVSGDSKWITGEEARHYVHQCRSRYSSVMTGVGTVLADDPMLNCRIQGGKNPVRIICDSNLRMPLESRIAATAAEIPTILASCCQNREKEEAYRKCGIKILHTAPKNGRVDLRELMKMLAKLEIDSIFMEGGGNLNWSALESGIVNKVQAYIAPKLFGGTGAKTPVGGVGVERPDQAFYLDQISTRQIGGDWLIEGKVKKSCLQES